MVSICLSEIPIPESQFETAKVNAAKKVRYFSANAAGASLTNVDCTASVGT